MVTIAIVIIIGWFVLISPERSKVTKLDAQIGDTNTQLAAVTALLNGPLGKQAYDIVPGMTKAGGDGVHGAPGR